MINKLHDQNGENFGQVSTRSQSSTCYGARARATKTPTKTFTEDSRIPITLFMSYLYFNVGIAPTPLLPDP
eukprot:2319567-Amphidinium_carterae.1